VGHASAPIGVILGNRLTLKATSVRTRLHSLFAFLRFLIDQDIIDGRILKRKIKLKVPDFLPRAIAPSDVRKLLGVVKEIRDRAMILVLSRQVWCSGSTCSRRPKETREI
jgi:site-specific recombinase XerC